MEKLVNNIINKEFKEAELSLKEELASLIERKLGEKKKIIMAAEGTIGKKESDEIKTGESILKPGSIKAQRKSLKKATKIVKEAMVQKDGLVHLATGEKILSSVYNARRWLTEASGGKAHFHDQWEIVKEKLPKGHEGHKHLDMAQKAVEDDDMEKAVKHLEHAAKMARSLKEDCGLAPDLEKKVEAAREMAKLLIQPQLDTTAPRVDRTKIKIPKAVRPADRLTAPDLGPKEDEWMHGKKLDEALGSLKNIKASAKTAAGKASKAAYAKFWAHDPEQGEKIKKFGKEEKAFAGAKKEIEKLKKKKLEEGIVGEIIKGLKLRGQIKKYKKSEDKKSLQRANELENLKNTKQFKHDAPNLYKYGYKLGSSTQVKFDPSRYKQIKNWASKKDE